MSLRIRVAVAICILLISTPFIVRGIESIESSSGPSTYAETGNATTRSSSGVIYSGSLESHQGADTLIVTPAVAYVPSPGSIVYVNVTVKFFHAQPCPHPGWKITLENLKDCNLIYSSETKLVNPYTAEKTYKLEVLGNGSVDVVYYYGPGCPYGTEERVTVRFYVGTPPGDNISSDISGQNSASLQSSSFWVNGTLSGINSSYGKINIGKYVISVKGRWKGPENGTYTWKSLMSFLEKYKGRFVQVFVEKGQEGLLLAKEIEVNGIAYWRG